MSAGSPLFWLFGQHLDECFFCDFMLFELAIAEDAVSFEELVEFSA
jgi:hypothetical protein